MRTWRGSGRHCCDAELEARPRIGLGIGLGDEGRRSGYAPRPTRGPRKVVRRVTAEVEVSGRRPGRKIGTSPDLHQAEWSGRMASPNGSGPRWCERAVSTKRRRKL